MSKYDEFATTVISLLGGKDNIISLTHCATRLRFVLKNENLADLDKIKEVKDVITVVKGGGQVQIVVGTKVHTISKAVEKSLGSQINNIEDDEQKKMSLIDKLFDIISKVFQPLLGVLCAAGMIKGFNNLFSLLGIYTADSGTYLIMNACGDAVFMFLPIMLGFTSAKKFKCNQFVGALIGATLCYPAIQLSTLSVKEPIFTLFANTAFEMNAYTDLFGLPIIALDYTSTVVPVIVAVYCASKIEKFLDKVINENLKFSFVPLFTILITMFGTLFVLGPITTLISNLISFCLSALYGISPLLYGIILYGFILVLIIFGLHWGLIALALTNIATLGYDFLVAAPGLTNVFTAFAAMIAIFLKTKDRKLKELTLSSSVSAFFGITEPSLYSVLLPLKKPFIYCCISNAIGGAIISVAGVRAYTFGGWGIFQFPTYINPANGDTYSMIWAIAGVGIATIISFIMNYIGYKDKNEKVEETITKKGGTYSIYSPMDGSVIPLSEVDDTAFSGGGLGDGIAIVPSCGKVYSPIDGTIGAFFQTKHAIVVKGNNGEEILIHIGINTCKLNGSHFTAYIKQNDVVSKGQLVLEFDLNKIKEEGYDLTSSITITNSSLFSKIDKTKKDTVKVGDELLTVQG